jgi:hypothetical protein
MGQYRQVRKAVGLFDYIYRPSWSMAGNVKEAVLSSFASGKSGWTFLSERKRTSYSVLIGSGKRIASRAAKDGFTCGQGRRSSDLRFEESHLELM